MNDKYINIIKDLERIYRELKEVEIVVNKDKKHIEFIINALKKEGDIK